VSEEPAFNPKLGSFTSGVDGSSEGGRIDTIRLPSTLALYGVALVNQLKARGYKGKLSFQPAIENGSWCLRLEYEGDEPPPAPELWHGHRIVTAQKPPPPPQQ
jgi:hypothetical protein